MVWTFVDTKKAALASLLPGAIAASGLCALSTDKNLLSWWENAKKPKWAPKDAHLYSAVDLLTLSTLGPASYLVYKHGGGFDYSDTKLALGLYGANLIFAAAAMPLTKLRNLKGLFYNNIFLNITAIATTYMFFKVHKTAGSLILPYSLWISFYTVLLYFMKSEEPKKN